MTIRIIIRHSLASRLRLYLIRRCLKSRSSGRILHMEFHCNPAKGLKNTVLQKLRKRRKIKMLHRSKHPLRGSTHAVALRGGKDAIWNSRKRTSLLERLLIVTGCWSDLTRPDSTENKCINNIARKSTFCSSVLFFHPGVSLHSTHRFFPIFSLLLSLSFSW